MKYYLNYRQTKNRTDWFTVIVLTTMILYLGYHVASV